MAIKDFIYLAVLGITALYFYRRGFRNGAYRTRKVWRAILEKCSPPKDWPPQNDLKQPASGHRLVVPCPKVVFTSSGVQSEFGKN